MSWLQDAVQAQRSELQRRIARSVAKEIAQGKRRAHTGKGQQSEQSPADAAKKSVTLASTAAWASSQVPVYGTSPSAGPFTPPHFMTSYSAYLFGKGSKCVAMPAPAAIQRPDPFVGWKTLRLHVREDGVRLVGAAKTPYGIDATAECRAVGTSTIYFMPNGAIECQPEPAHDEPAPKWDCTCGFYALSARPTDWEYGAFLAQVEVFGTVIEGTRGWRAGRQRVLSLFAKPQCSVSDCSAAPIGFQVGVEGAPIGFQVGVEGAVWAACRKHAPFGYASLAQLSALVGTEVRWSE